MRRSAGSPLRLAVPAIAMALLLGGCGTGPTRTISDGRFVLELTASRLDYRVGDAVDVRATLRYTGRESSITVLPDDVGLVAFTFRQLDGPGLMSPISNLMCSREPVTLWRGRAETYRPPDWMAGPDVRLPAGTWQVQAHVGSCTVAVSDEDNHNLTTPPLVVTVTP